MATMTKADIASFNPQILASDIQLGLKTDFSFLDGKSFQLVNKEGMKPGRTLTIPTSGQLSDFTTKAEGVDMDEDSFTTGEVEVTPATYAKKVSYSMESEASFKEMSTMVVTKMTQAMKSTIDTLIFNAIETSTTTPLDYSTETIGLDAISLARASVKMKDPSKYTLYISFNQEHQLRTLKDANDMTVWKDAIGEDMLKEGVIGTIYGIKIKTDSKIVADTGVYTNYLVQDGAVILAWALEGLNLDAEVDKSKLVKWIYSHMVMGTVLDPAGAIQPIKFKE